jgi:predicted DNA repair protein MutK
MAGGSLLALIDDIASVLDDVAVLSKLAAKKTSGVLGDDLALNAQQVAGVIASREIPVVLAVAKGSLLNKAILVPAALLISAFIPMAVVPLLMIGGAFLCFEGVEKLAHRFLHGGKTHDPAAEEDAPVPQPSGAAADAGAPDLQALEKEKIKGAVRTDFVLSAEIIAITLGTVAGAAFATQVMVLSGIALLMTVGVYGFVAGIVKLDDAGLWLSRRAGALSRLLGRAILALAPWLMKALSVLGTAAMFLVGGGILVHGIAPLHHAIQALIQPAQGVSAVLLSALGDALVGLVGGAIVLGVVLIGKKMLGRRAAA